MESLTTPAYLKAGDTIGIIAPARKVAESEITPFIKMMEERGFRVVWGSHMLGSKGQFSGTARERLMDLQQMFTDPEIKAVICARGGYGSAQLLKDIDWEVIRNNPKWFIGFSDITALHSAFGKFMETIHAVMPYSLVMEEPQTEESFNYLLRFLKGEQLEYRIPDHPGNIPGRVSGQLTGGNLSVLFSLAGTAYEPDYRGKILFLEDLDEYLYHIDRMILNFELRGIFQKISGLIIGDFSDMHDNSVSFGSSAYEIIHERALKYRVPTQFGFPAGHKKNNFPLIFGRLSTLTVKQGANTLQMY
jgi:muramoyltetrapeptide carboxypeptidase